MILPPLPPPEAGPVPEDSTFADSRWLGPDWYHPFLDKKPAEVREYYEPLARAVAFAVALIRESRRHPPDPESVEHLAQQTEYFLSVAGPAVNARWPELAEIRDAHGLDPFVQFMGDHPNAAAAALAYPKHVVRLLVEARLAEQLHVAAEHQRGNTEEEFSWVRVALRLRAASVGMGDPAPLMAKATHEALRWAAPGRPALASAAREGSPQLPAPPAADKGKPRPPTDSRPDRPTAEYCLPRPGWARWEGEIRLRPQLWTLLGFLLQRKHWPVPFDAVEDLLWRGEEPRSKRVQNIISELNEKLAGVNCPWEFSTGEAHIEYHVLPA